MSRRGRTLVALALLVGVALGASSAEGKFGVGSLDPKFGHRGKVVTRFNRPHAEASQAVLQPDGRIVVAGQTSNYDYTLSRLALARYRPSGSLDQSFGSGGKVTFSLGSARAFARGLALQGDGKIVIAAGTAEHAVVLRLNANGSLDTTFGTRGQVITPLYVASAITVQQDGRIVIGGSTPHEFALVRYNTNGSLDSSFGTNGVTTTSFGGDAWIESLALAPDRKIVAVGQGPGGYALARYNSDGSLDRTFGEGGTVGESGEWPPISYGLSAAALQRDGKIVAIGSDDEAWDHGEDAYSVVVRFTDTGVLDPGFGTHGAVITNFGSYALGSSVAIEPDGKILAAGSAQSSGWGDYDFLAARYEPDGVLDPGFGDSGVERTDFTCSPATECWPSDDYASSVLLQPSGNIVLAGLTVQRHRHVEKTEFALARYLARLPRCVVPRVVGRTVGHARGLIGRSYCNLGRVKWVNSRLAPRRWVIGQRPAAGTRVPGGTKVRLVVSRGRNPGPY